MFARCGVYNIVRNDRERNFASELMPEMCLLLGVKKVPIALYQPESNGQIEDFHRILNSRLSCETSGKYMLVLYCGITDRKPTAPQNFFRFT
jgi:Integrase core domain.